MMKSVDVILGAAYIGPYTEWSWVSTLVFIVIGIFLFWILYKLVFSKMNSKTDGINEKEEIRKVVIPNKPQADENGITPIYTKEETLEAEEEIVMPLKGELMEITKVPEPTFSEKMVGDGFAIKPSSGEIVAPVNGYIKEIGPNKSSITFNTLAGRDVILHIGLSVTHVFNCGIRLDIKEGDKVKAGSKIGFIDLEQITLGTCSTISPVVFPKLKENEKIIVKQQGLVEAGMKEVVSIEIGKI